VPSLRILCGCALIAVALTLSACDDAAGPVLSNEEIIAQMKVAQSKDSTSYERNSLRQIAISALTAGSPATLGTLEIDGKSHLFTFTGASTAIRSSSGSGRWMTYVIGWRHPDGDTLVALSYYDLFAGAMRRAPGLATSGLGGSHLASGDVARMIVGGKGTVSKESVPRFDLQEATLFEGDVRWSTVPQGIMGGSAAVSDASAECQNTDSEDFLAVGLGSLVSCELRTLSVDGSAHFRRFLPDESERVIDLPPLTLVGPIAVFR